MTGRQISAVSSHCNAGSRNSKMQKEEFKFLWLSRAACCLVPEPTPATPLDKVTATVRPKFCFQDREEIVDVFSNEKKLQQLTFHNSSGR